MFLLNLLLLLAEPAFLYSHAHLARNGTMHSVLGPPIPIVNENVPQIMSPGHFDGSNVSFVALSSQVCQRLVQS